MRDLNKIDNRVMWLNCMPKNEYGIRCAKMIMPSGTTANLVVGDNEDGWEHVSIELMARRLPTWEEMCLIKEIFWEDDEEVVQIHPRKSDYVNIVEALHLWRPKDGNWEKLNSK